MKGQEEILLESLNKFGNFKTVKQEFTKRQLEVIYEAMRLSTKQPPKHLK